MRARARLAQFAAPHLHHHDGLSRDPGGLERRDEAGGFADALGVDGDDIRVRIPHHPADHLADGDVRLVARGDAERRAQAALARQGEQMRPIGARLADDADPARRWKPAFQAGGERPVEPHAVIEQAERVRPQQPHPMRPRQVRHLGLQRRAVAAHLGKPGGEHDRGLHAARAQLLDGRDRSLGRDRDDGDIRRFGHVSDARIGRQPLDFRSVRIDRDDAAAKPALQHVGDRAAADPGGGRTKRR